MKEKNEKKPPNDLPIYRILTGPDDSKFCQRVSEALSIGYKLYGSPSATFNGENVIVAQAIIWPQENPKNYQNLNRKQVKNTLG